MLIATIIITSIILIFLIALWYLKNDPHYITRFLKENKNKSSICVIRNNEVFVALNENKLMPLASTVKIILALEYANQLSKNTLSKNEFIDLNELNKFYLPNTDAGAHNSWLKELEHKKLIRNNSVALDEIVKGMIKFSSNANSEYLIGKFGKENINASIKNENLNHTPVYPFVSSLIVSSSNRELADEDFISGSWAIHERLKNGDEELLKSFRIPKLAAQRIWSDKLPASTTKDYSDLMNKINTGKLSDINTAKHLKEILSWPMEFNPVNKNHFTSLGMKSGSTAFVVTETLFATDKSGSTAALAIFFNDLADWEKVLIDWNLNKFELKILFDEKFRNSVKDKLSN